MASGIDLVASTCQMTRGKLKEKVAPGRINRANAYITSAIAVEGADLGRSYYCGNS